MTRVADVLSDLQLSPNEISKKSRLPLEKVVQMLNGGQASLADLRALSRGLRIPLQRFSMTSEVRPDLGLLFRSTTKNRSDIGAEAAYAFVAGALEILPKRSNSPEWLEEFQFSGETATEAIRLANLFRDIAVPGRLDEPIIDLPKILMGLPGLVLGRLETSRFEGASIVAGGYAFIFVSPRFPGRMLFTLAHELGHLVAHHKESQKVVFDLASQIGSYRHKTRSESFVDAFASALLLPARGVAIALEQIRRSLDVTADAIGDIEILFLSRLFGVSFEAAALRCEALELLPEGGAYSLSNHLKKTFGSAEKRASNLDMPARQNVVIPCASENLLRAAASKIESGEVSLGWVTDKFGCAASDVYSVRRIPEATDGHRR